ncbi:MAG TPA: hypothetical protein VMP41_15195 [Acidimicrobiales bacterium]|nr:hypothetical protein [Acidimicrobiales bacterium]
MGRESRQERIDRFLHPGEEVIAQTPCQQGRWPDDSGTGFVVVITNERLLMFRTTWFLGKNSGELLGEMDLDNVRTVDSKTSYILLGIPVVQTHLECDDGQVLQIVSGAVAFRRARSVARALTDRIGRTPANPTAKLVRFWFEFERGRTRRIGVTAWTKEDAEALVTAKVFKGAPMPSPLTVIEDIDESQNDPNHVLPDMEPPDVRGIWFPRGYR